MLGTVFGHMARGPHAANFFTFVTAHGPFELTAIVFSGAAGLRLGYGLIDTQGQTRLASLRREAARALPVVGGRGGPVRPGRLPRRLRLRLPASATAPRRRSPSSPPRCWSPTWRSGAGQGRAEARGRPGPDGLRTNPGPDPRTAVPGGARPRAGRRAQPARSCSAWRRWRGSHPSAALNAWLTSNPEFPLPLFALLVFLEVPLGDRPLTMVLGGLMFGQRPRPAGCCAGCCGPCRRSSSTSSCSGWSWS